MKTQNKVSIRYRGQNLTNTLDRDRDLKDLEFAQHDSLTKMEQFKYLLRTIPLVIIPHTGYDRVILEAAIACIRVEIADDQFFYYALQLIPIYGEVESVVPDSMSEISMRCLFSSSSHVLYMTERLAYPITTEVFYKCQPQKPEPLLPYGVTFENKFETKFPKRMVQATQRIDKHKIQQKKSEPTFLTGEKILNALGPEVSEKIKKKKKP